MAKVYTSDIRQFNKMNFKIEDVFPMYRTWFVKIGDSGKFRTFKLFPKSDTKVLVQGDSELLMMKEEKRTPEEWREQIWNKEDRVFEFHKGTVKIDKDFYQNFKKVFDISILLEKEIEVKKYKDVTDISDEVVLSWVGSGKIKNMIRTLVDEEIPMVDGKDRTTGEKIKVEAYDFEDTMKDLLKGKFCQMKITWVGMDTKYIFVPWKEFDKKEEESILDSIPF